MYPEEKPRAKKPFPKRSEKPESRDVVGLVVFDGEKFLLLHRLLNWRGWEFPKGHMQAGEAVADAIRRELFEETALVKFEIAGPIDRLTYYDRVRHTKTFIRNYLLRVSSNNKISFANQPAKDGKAVAEHDGFKWCFPGEAVKMLTHKNMKETMKKAIKMLGLEIEK